MGKVKDMVTGVMCDYEVDDKEARRIVARLIMKRDGVDDEEAMRILARLTEKMVTLIHKQKEVSNG